jgi:hypothetical protein
VNVDTLGNQAARALRAAALNESAAVDPAAALRSLHRLRRGRTAVRSALAAGAVAVTATAIMGLPFTDDSEHATQEPAASPSLPALGAGYDVIASATSPDGTAEAVATYRDGQPAVVLIRTAGSSAMEVAWSAPTAHERGTGSMPFPAAVGWAPDGSRLAILVGQERPRELAASSPVDLALVTTNPDGTSRQTVAQVGTCDCAGVLPTLTWSSDRVAITIPDGPDQGLHIEEMQ